MPYTNAVIDPTKPADTDLASMGDDEIRQLKLDLKERLESFFEDVDADPLVAKDGAITFPEMIENLAVGLAVDRPDQPGDGRNAYYAVDTQILSLSNGATIPANLAWVTYNMALIGATQVVPQYAVQTLYSATSASPKFGAITQCRLVAIRVLNAVSTAAGHFDVPLSEFLTAGIDPRQTLGGFMVNVWPAVAVRVSAYCFYDPVLEAVRITITQHDVGGNVHYVSEAFDAVLFITVPA
jgi:hypothetical protein